MNADNKSKLESYLTTLKEQPLTHFTIIDIDRVNENISDIEKYTMKRVEAVPLNDREVDMDHLCFVDIFPFGCGGMYDKREVIVKPAMYIRWILNQAVPAARRNIQYLFSAIHNKDVRAIDSGIFAQIRSSKIPNLTANLLRNNLVNNEKKLETNLFNCMRSCRGTKEYWCQVNGDLRAFDEHFPFVYLFFYSTTTDYPIQHHLHPSFCTLH